MIGSLLQAVADHLAHGGRHVAVAERPADVGASLPFAVVYSQSATFTDDDVQQVDRSGSHLVQVQTWGTSPEQCRLLSEALDDRMKMPGIVPDGHTVTLVKRDMMAGPARDDGTYPEPSRWRTDMVYRLWTEPTT